MIGLFGERSVKIIKTVVAFPIIILGIGVLSVGVLYSVQDVSWQKPVHQTFSLLKRKK